MPPVGPDLAAAHFLLSRGCKVKFEGSYPQTRAFMIAIERMQMLLVVKNLRTKLEQGNKVIEVEWRQNKFVPVSKPESRLITSFDMHALLALSEQESLTKENLSPEKSGG